MDFSVPLGRAEFAAMFLSAFLVGVGLGAMLAGLPHPTALQHTISSWALAPGLVLWIGFLLFRANKQWKVRTSS